MEESFKQSLKKVLVPDDRLVQRAPQYAMNLGPQNVKVNYTPANATSPNNVQWTVLPPSYNTRTDRFACVQGFINYYFDVTLTANGTGNIPVNSDIWSFGSDGGVSAFPLHLECLDNNKCSMNDEDFTMNSADVNMSILRAMDNRKLYYERSTPSSLDRFCNYNDASATTGAMNVLSGYFDSSADRINNGAYPIFFTDYQGNLLSTSNGVNPTVTVDATNGNATAYQYVKATNQVRITTAIATGASATYRIFCKIPIDEPAICNPFVFDEIYMKESSLFEIKGYVIDYNMKAVPRIIKQFALINSLTNIASLAVVAQGYNNIAAAGPFEKFNFVNYWLQLPAQIMKSPAQCVVPYMEFPRSITTNNSAVAAGSIGNKIISNVVEPMGVNDLLIISVLPQSYANAPAANPYIEANWQCAITGVSIQWGEKANLLSDFSQYELFEYDMVGMVRTSTSHFIWSIKNGCNMWRSSLFAPGS